MPSSGRQQANDPAREASDAGRCHHQLAALPLVPQVAPLGQAAWERSQLNMGAVTTWEGDPMDTFWGLSATAWTAIYTLLTLGLLLVAVIAAAYAKRQWKVARQAQLEASRPYVIVTAEPSAASRRLFDLSIRNIGKRPAINVRVRLDPPPLRAKEIDGHEFAKMKMLNQPIAMLAPDQDMRAFWDSHLDRHGADMPTSHQVTITYSDTSGAAYDEKSVVDLDSMQGSVFTEVKTVHDLGKSLDEIRKILKDASILSRKGNAEVLAITESRHSSEERKDREVYESLRSTLQAAQEWNHGGPDEVARLRAKVHRWEQDHPHLMSGPRGEGSFKPRNRLKQAVKALVGSLLGPPRHSRDSSLT